MAARDAEDACELIAADARRAFATLPGFGGPVAAGGRFLREWEALTGARGRVAVALRIYRAGIVSAPPEVAGEMRPYEQGDREVVLRWLSDFVGEAMPTARHEDAAHVLDSRLTMPDEGFVVWDSAGVVSLAGYAGPTPHGIRIGPVYTPPDRRGNGYASALVAELTRSLLSGGRRFCFLFTDLANPTSNAIYQRVGYRRVTDFNHWTFD